MQKLPEIKASYEWFMELYNKEVAILAQSNNLIGLTKLRDYLDFMERGYFVIMFAQFENAVNDKFESARQARITNVDWTQRRGWDADSLNGAKVPFETKLAMVMDKKKDPYGKVKQAYEKRNHCAHGGTTLAVGSIDSLENDLYDWSAKLK